MTDLMKCSLVHLKQQHPAHDWEPQPGMEPVHCVGLPGWAQQDVAPFVALYEQWVKAGSPPLGTLMARWWDARLVEMRNAIQASIADSRKGGDALVVRPGSTDITVLSEADWKILKFAIDEAFDVMCSRDGFTDEDWASMEKLRTLVTGEPS